MKDFVVNEISIKQDIAGNIQGEASRLTTVSNDYFLYQADADLAAWKISYVLLIENLSAVNSTLLSAQQAIVDHILSDMEQLNSTFAQLIRFLQTTPRNQSIRILPEFQSLWSQATGRTQSLALDSAQLSQTFRNQSDQLQFSNILLLLALVALVGGYFFVNYLVLYRRTLKSIAALQAGTAIIGSGNLDYTIKIDKKDEIGDLSGSFNKMTMNLKNLTAKLKDQERMAAIGQTAGMVGHDLRNPLQSIVGEVYLAQMELKKLADGEQKESLQENLQQIAEQISYMDKIVSDLQTFVKPVEVHKEECNLKELVVDVLSQVAIPSNVQADVPLNASLNVSADPLLLKRVLINLVTNAIQAMPHGGKLTITAQVDDDGQVKIDVVDTGMGIPVEIQPKIFTPLFTTKAKGQGFGLAVCKRVLEAQGGTIGFESEAGKGTKFRVTLPR
jgi:signal transduction histidine kinase